jgi:MerR family redox-sensitive transcriptional activator SoxR
MEDWPDLPIGEIARRAGVAPSTIRYYESIGLLPEPERESGQRRYDEAVVRRIELVAIAQKAGFSLREISELMPALGGEEPMADPMRLLAGRKLGEVDALLERAQAMKQWLELAADCTCRSSDECSLFPAEGEPGDADAPLRIVQVEGKDGRPSCRVGPVKK